MVKEAEKKVELNSECQTNRQNVKTSHKNIPEGPHKAPSLFRYGKKTETVLAPNIS